MPILSACPKCGCTDISFSSKTGIGVAKHRVYSEVLFDCHYRIEYDSIRCKTKQVQHCMYDKDYHIQLKKEQDALMRIKELVDTLDVSTSWKNLVQFQLDNFRYNE